MAYRRIARLRHRCRFQYLARFSSTADHFHARNSTLLKESAAAAVAAIFSVRLLLLLQALVRCWLFQYFRTGIVTHVCPNDLGKQHVRGAERATGREAGNWGRLPANTGIRKFRGPRFVIVRSEIRPGTRAKTFPALCMRGAVWFNPLLFQVCRNRAQSRFTRSSFWPICKLIATLQSFFR